MTIEQVFVWCHGDAKYHRPHRHHTSPGLAERAASRNLLGVRDNRTSLCPVSRTASLTIFESALPR